MLRWHEEFSEKLRRKLNLSHYAVYWICWLEGLLTALIVWWFVGQKKFVDYAEECVDEEDDFDEEVED